MMNIWTTTAAALALAAASSAGSTWDDNRWGKPVEVGPLLQNISIQHCVIGEEAGEPTAFFTVAGKPAVFNVVGLEDYRLIHSFPLEGADRSWSHAVATDGTVFIAGVGMGASAHLYRYRPGAGRVEDLGAPVRGHKLIWALTPEDRGGGWMPEKPGGNGKMLATVNYGGGVAFLDVETGRSRSLPTVAAGAIHALEPGPDGVLYVSGCIGSTGARFDPVSGDIETFAVGQTEGIVALGNTLYWGAFIPALVTKPNP